jgi:RNA polymerase sigma-B factor
MLYNRIPLASHRALFLGFSKLNRYSVGVSDYTGDTVAKQPRWVYRSVKSQSQAVNQTVDRQDELVRDYLPLVRQIARRYSRARSAPVEDLVQVGALGLLKAIKRFDAESCKNPSLRSYAALFIKGEISHYLRDNASLVQAPRRLLDAGRLLSRAEEALRRGLGRAPTLDELALRCGISVDEVIAVLQSRDACTYYRSFDAGREEDVPSLSETLADQRHVDAQERAETREAIAQSLKNLGEKTRQIMEFVYFQDLTQKETAHLLGWSEMKVSRALRRGLSKLKEILLTEIF